MRGEGCWDDPFVVGFMNISVEEGEMKPAVDPVYAVVGEDEEANIRKQESAPNLHYTPKKER